MSREDPGHLFLLSIASLSVVVGGCGDGLPGGTPSSAPIPSDDDDNGLEGQQDDQTDPTSAASPCGQYAAVFVECYQGPGYDYGEGGNNEAEGLDVGYLEAQCLLELNEETARYGPECGAALSELYACIGGLSCEALLSGQNDEICLDIYTRLNDACTDPIVPEPDPDSSTTNDPGTTGGSDSTDDSGSSGG